MHSNIDQDDRVYLTVHGSIDRLLPLAEQEIPGFAAHKWSPEGRRMSGFARNALQDYAEAIYGFEADEWGLNLSQSAEG